MEHAHRPSPSLYGSSLRFGIASSLRRGAKALGLEPGQVVDREAYDLLFGERKAPDGTQLGKRPGGGRKAADIYARLLAAEPHATAGRRP